MTAISFCTFYLSVFNHYWDSSVLHRDFVMLKIKSQTFNGFI